MQGATRDQQAPRGDETLEHQAGQTILEVMIEDMLQEADLPLRLTSDGVLEVMLEEESDTGVLPMVPLPKKLNKNPRPKELFFILTANEAYRQQVEQAKRKALLEAAKEERHLKRLEAGKGNAAKGPKNKKKTANVRGRRSEVNPGSSSEDICTICRHTYGDHQDPLVGDERVACMLCQKWWHETCSSDSGRTSSEGFTCEGCGH